MEEECPECGNERSYKDDSWKTRIAYTCLRRSCRHKWYVKKEFTAVVEEISDTVVEALIEQSIAKAEPTEPKPLEVPEQLLFDFDSDSISSEPIKSKIKKSKNR